MEWLLATTWKMHIGKRFSWLILSKSSSTTQIPAELMIWESTSSPPLHLNNSLKPISSPFHQENHWLLRSKRNPTLLEGILTGILRELLFLSKIKVNVAPAGLSQQLEVWRPYPSWNMENFKVFQSKCWWTALILTEITPVMAVLLTMPTDLS